MKRGMIPTTRRIDQILTDSLLAAPLIARLAAARQAAQAIALICAEVAPDFDPMQPGACDLREKTLRIWVRSGAHSTKLRQSSPRLVASLQLHGLEINEIKVGVQPGRVRENPARNARNSGFAPTGNDAITAITSANYLAALDASRKLALALPESGLRAAVDRLKAAIDARLARMRESDQSFEQQNHEENDPGAQSGQK